MKRLLLFLGMLLSLLLVHASTVKDLHIDVLLNDNGSAAITEHWHIDASSDITEWYIVKDGLGPMKIQNFQVAEKGVGKFTVENGEWDIDRDIDEKARRCGMVKKDEGHYELCWGIGSEGEHTFDVSYTLTGLMKAYPDADGFNHMFVARDIGEDMGAITVTISKNDTTTYTKDNAAIWAFGFRNGTILFENGKIVARTNPNDWNKSDCVIVMCRFPKGDYHPVLQGEGKFEDVKAKAFENSSYTNNGGDSGDGEWGALEWIITIVMIVLAIIFYLISGWIGVMVAGVLIYGITIAWWIVSLAPLRVWRKRKKLGALGWYRNIPFEGDLNIAKTVIDRYSYRLMDTDKENVIGAMILRLLYHGCIAMQPNAKHPKKQDIKLLELKDEMAPEEKELYLLIKEAMGNDGLLSDGEMKKYLKVHPEKGKDFFELIDQDPEYDKENLEEQRHVLELKKFLEEFTLVDERNMEEVKLWKEYLVYAQLFGIAKRVRKQLKEVWPEFYVMNNVEDEDDYMATTLLGNSFSSAMSSGYSSGSGGSGGSSSGGGGGGCSGGSSGGGGR